MKKIWILSISFLFLQACVPAKKLVYLQDDGSTPEKLAHTEYRFKPNDLIYVRIKTREPKMNELFGGKDNINLTSGSNLYFQTNQVNREGFIELPLIGKIQVSGKTAGEIKTQIENILLAGFFKNKQDFYVVVKPAGINVTVLGEVNNPGSVNLLKENPNVLEAIAQSGEIKLTGDRTEVLIIRQKPDGTREIDYLDLTRREVMNSPYFYLENNDIVYVKPLPQKSLGTGTTLVNTISTLMGLTSFLISIYLLTAK